MVYIEAIVTSGLRAIVSLFLSTGESKLGTEFWQQLNFSKGITKR